MYLELNYDGCKKVIKKDLICYISSENEEMILCIWKKLKDNLSIE